MHVIQVGLGNIGSHAAPLIAAIPGITRITLVDRDRYEARNLENQSLRAGDVGKSKVAVVARRLRAAHPRMKVDAICDSVEKVPLGALKCDVLLGAVDTRLTRQYLNEASRRLGVPWIDSGVHADAGLARISTFPAGPDAACLECGWDDRHYATLETAYPCGAEKAVRTGATASLGALAGALLAIECEQWFAGARCTSQELVFDTHAFKHRIIDLHPLAKCRFPHPMTPIRAAKFFSSKAPISQLFAMGAAVSVVGAGDFARNTGCRACGSRYLWTLANRLVCRCGLAVHVSGSERMPRVSKADLTATLLVRPLTRFGIKNGDILSLEGSYGQTFVQIGEPHA